MVRMVATKDFDLGRNTRKKGQTFAVDNYFARILERENKAKPFKGTEKEWQSYVSV